MRTKIKQLLRKYGYPPDQQDNAVKTVMEQAELLCENESYTIDDSFGLGMVAE
jgi:type I restriction enzyme R subunit